MRLLIVEDEALMREVLTKLARGRCSFESVSSVADGEEALAAFEEEAFDVVLLDLLIPKICGVNLAVRIFQHWPNTRILTISNEFDDYTMHRIFSCGVHGYVDKKSASLDVLAEAIQTVAAGRAYFTRFAMDLRQKLQNDPEAFTRILSNREQDVLVYFGQGMSDQKIADKFGIKPRTVQTHRHNILKKLELHGTPELMNYAVRKGFWKYRESVDGAFNDDI